MSFEDRSRDHSIGMNYVRKWIQSQFPDFKFREMGTEYDRDLEKDGLWGPRYDDTINLIKYRPDTFIYNDTKSLNLEIKTERGNWPNWAIEQGSYKGSELWSRLANVLYIFLELGERNQVILAKCCLSTDIQPWKIFIPDRKDYEAQLLWCEHFYPEIPKQKVPKSKKGSGTPYFLVSKSNVTLVDFYELMKAWG